MDKRVMQLVDPGEGEAIMLATERDSHLLLIDDRRGRIAARGHNVRIIGTGAVLLAAKRHGLLQEVGPVLNDLSAEGYRFSPALWKRIVELAGE